MVSQYLQQLPYEIPIPVTEFARNEVEAFVQRISVDVLETRSGAVLIYADGDAESVLLNFGPVIQRRMMELMCDAQGNIDVDRARDCFGVTVGYALWSALGVESCEKFWLEDRMRSFRDSWFEIFEDLIKLPNQGRIGLWRKFVTRICESRTTTRDRLADFGR